MHAGGGGLEARRKALGSRRPSSSRWMSGAEVTALGADMVAAVDVTRNAGAAGAQARASVSRVRALARGHAGACGRTGARGEARRRARSPAVTASLVLRPGRSSCPRAGIRQAGKARGGRVSGLYVADEQRGQRGGGRAGAARYALVARAGSALALRSRGSTGGDAEARTGPRRRRHSWGRSGAGPPSRSSPRGWRIAQDTSRVSGDHSARARSKRVPRAAVRGTARAAGGGA